jgi:hypothetical protein
METAENRDSEFSRYVRLQAIPDRIVDSKETGEWAQEMMDHCASLAAGVTARFAFDNSSASARRDLGQDAANPQNG